MSLSKNEIKFVKNLQQKKFRDLEGLFIVEGIKMVNELLEQDKFAVKSVFGTSSKGINHFTEFQHISQAELERISGFKSPNQVLAVAEQSESMDPDMNENNLILLLDDVKDPGNLGTIIRTADWFGITQIICSPNTVDLYNPKVIQASMGAIFRMEIFYQDLNEAVLSLKNKSYDVLGAAMDGENAFNYSYQSKTALVMGSESHGLSDELIASCIKVTIPKTGKTESLNVGMAAGILMAEYRKSN